MAIVKWQVGPYSSEPERREYEKETACFYLFRSGSARLLRRDRKVGAYYRYFNGEDEALDYIRQREECKKDKRRVDQINRCGVELLGALEALVLFTNPKPSNSAALNRAHQAIAKARGDT